MKYIKINLGQKFNKLKTIKLDHCKKTPICEKYNMPKHIVLKRLKSGWNLKDIIETPIRGIK